MCHIFEFAHLEEFVTEMHCSKRVVQGLFDGLCLLDWSSLKAMADLKACDRNLFFSRGDSADPRLGDLVKTEIQTEEIIILGYPDDEGIGLNGGRQGAALAPDEIRRWLYRMTPHPKKRLRSFCDAGNLNLEGPLEDRHERAIRVLEPWFKAGRKVLSLGGGNDYAYPDGLAFLKTSTKPLIINVDAHFDVRDTKRGLNSGTPFYRLLESGLEFDFVELGIQPQCNSKAHWEYVEKKGGTIITVDEVLASGLSWARYVTEQLGEKLLKRRPAFLALDIDAFSWPYAIGSSQSWPLGLMPQDFWPLYQILLQRLDVRLVGIYEVSPPLDVERGTAKWAAQLAHGFLHNV